MGICHISDVTLMMPNLTCQCEDIYVCIYVYMQYKDNCADIPGI